LHPILPFIELGKDWGGMIVERMLGSKGLFESLLGICFILNEQTFAGHRYLWVNYIQVIDPRDM